MNYSNPDLEQALDGARTADELEAAIAAIAGLVPSFMDPSIWGRKIFWPELDRLIPQVARRLKLDDAPRPKANDNICVLATRFYATGGHSRVAADICRAFGADRTTVIWTDIYNQAAYRQIINARPVEYPSRSFLLLSSKSRVEKILELYMLLKALRPSRIFLMHNHMDLVAVAGAWPFRDVTDLVHHADYLPSIGATLPFSAHADLTATCHPACKSVLPAAEYVGMALAELGEAPRPHSGAGRLRIVTCGGENKYRDVAHQKWSDFALAALRDRDAEIVHIGPVNEAFVERMAQALIAAGLSPDRYRCVGAKPDLRAALADEQADIFLGSFPEGGGRALLEALSLGVPAILPEAAEQGPFLRQTLPISGWRTITRPAEMAEAIDGALAQRDQLRSPEYRRALSEEFGRFDAYLQRDRPSDIS